MEHFSSNGCLILQHIILFSMLREDPNSDIFCAIWESTLAEISQCDRSMVVRCFWSSFNLPHVSKEGYEPLHQQYNMSLLVAQYPISYAERICKIWHLCAIWESTSPETTQPDTWWACICCKKNLSHFSWIWWRLWNTSTAMEVSACSILSHLSL